MWGSILEGLPIGSFLMWEPPADFDRSTLARHRLGPLPIHDSDPETIILDGQNRLATIAWSLFQDLPKPDDMSPAERETWDTFDTLVADFDERSIRFVPNCLVTDGPRFSMSKLLDSGEFWPYLRDHAKRFSDDAINWFDHVSTQVREARVINTMLHRATPEEAKRAFLHICKVGVPMSEADFDAAIGWDSNTALRR
jgi:hypothetical protein